MSTHPPTLGRVLGSWTLDPGVLIVCSLAAIVYGVGVARLDGRWPWPRAMSFLAGLFVLTAALCSGVDPYAQELLSIHVIQHLLLIVLAPTLLLWGTPVRLALSASPRAARHAIGYLLRTLPVRLLTRPAFGFALVTLVVLGTHMTGLYEAALRNPALHELEHAAYFWTGLLFLAPLLACDPIPHPPGAIARFAWLMAAMVVMSIPSGVFLFDGHVRYPFYEHPAQVLHTSALADQGNAGVIMFVGGGVAMGGLAMVIAMRAMIVEERRQRRRDTYTELAGT